MTTKREVTPLRDIATRHQLYLEGVKNYSYQSYLETSEQIRLDIRKIFLDVPFADMGQMTKRDLQELIKRLRKAQLLRWTAFTQRLLRELQEFMDADLKVNAEMLLATQEELDPEYDNYDRKKQKTLLGFLLAAKRKLFWGLILAAPLPAVGITAALFLTRFTEGARVNAEAALWKGWANRLPAQEAMALLLGTDRLNNRNGLTARWNAQARTVIDTLFQHVASMVQERTAEILFSHYRWVSVLDNKTTPICTSRAGKIYEYGKGPLPPAHPDCRSHTEPVDDDATDDNEDSYFDWLRRQPAAFQDDILGPRRGKAFRENRMTDSDLPTPRDAKPLTPEQFLGKLQLMLL